MFHLKKWQRLPSKVYEDSDAEDSFISHDGSIRIGPLKERTKFWPACFTIANLGIFAASIYLFGRSDFRHHGGRNAALKATSFYSPILDSIDISTSPQIINGTLFPPSWLSIARADPGPETDAAWAEYENVLTHVITREQVVALGKDPSSVARFEDSYWGLGDDAYMAQMDVFHQIHCLNMLRRAAFEDHPAARAARVRGGEGRERRDKMYWIHLHHCVDIILQNTKCSASADLLTLSWIDGRAIPWPNFSVYHQCRDFDALVQWQRDNAVDVEKFDRMVKPEGVTALRAPWLVYPEGETRDPEGWEGGLFDVGPLFGEEEEDWDGSAGKHRHHHHGGVGHDGH